MFADVPDDQFVAAIDACVTDLLWEVDIAEPPVDTAVVAARLGLVVAHNDRLAVRGRLLNLAEPLGDGGGQGVIVVGLAERPERLQWTIAHEIGEHIAQRACLELGLRANHMPDGSREQIANRLASCLLLPRDWFAAAGCTTDWDLLALKQRFSTASYELIARRLLDMPQPVVVTLCDQGRLRWRRSNAGGRLARLMPVEKSVWRQTHELGSPHMVRAQRASTGLESVRGWPIHEPGWKREILRSEIADTQAFEGGGHGW